MSSVMGWSSDQPFLRRPTTLPFSCGELPPKRRKPPPSTCQVAHSRLEVGVHIPGAAAGIDMFVSSDRLFDDGVLPMPRAVRSSSIGMRFATQSLW